MYYLSNPWRKLLVIALFLFAASAHAATGTIDATNKYAWGENIGWVNFGTSQGAVTVSDTELSGYAWGENIGWISLNCSNTGSCATVNYKISNTTEGALSGYAWSENAGWINFSPGFGANPTISTSTGIFSGYAWGENTGWISFNCSNTSSCATVDFKVSTDWRPSGGGGGGGGGGPMIQPTASAAPSNSPPIIPSAAPSVVSSPGIIPPHVIPPGIIPPVVAPPSEPPTGAQPENPPASQPTSSPSPSSSPSIFAPPIAVAAHKIVRAVSMITGIGVAVSAAASAVSLASAGVNFFNFISFFFKNILVFFGLKRKTRAWGTIYNAATKQPLPYTKVQLIGNDHRVLETRITDREGRYGFLAQAGEFTILPVRDEFRFPSQKVAGPSDTILYPHVYNGGTITTQTDELIKFDIPMDPMVEKLPITNYQLPKITLHNFFVHVSNVFFWVALVMVPLTYILYPTLLNLIILILFVVLNLFIIVGDLRQRAYGLVLDRSTEQTVPYSLVTLNDAAGQRKGFTVSDDQGRYFLLSEKGRYKVSVYTPANVAPPRSAEESLTARRGWIAKKLHL